MAGNFTVNDDGTITVQFTYTAVTAKVQAAVGNAAEHLYHHYPIFAGEETEPVPFEELTNQQKLNIVDKHVKRVILDAARANLVNVATNAAREAALEDDSIDLG